MDDLHRAHVGGTGPLWMSASREAGPAVAFRSFPGCCLGRREFSQIPESLSYRFRDVYDHLVRLSDEAVYFQDRISSLLDAHLSTVSNQLNGIMKVLTLISTIFLPLTVLTGMWGMNVTLPHLPGGDRAQFWWVLAMMFTLSAGMLYVFRRRRWI